MATFNIFIATQFNDLKEDYLREMEMRIEEACFEKIPTIPNAWETAIDAPDEAEAKSLAIDKFINVVRTYPCELKMVVQAGTGQILRRKKVFEA